jgi:transposase InsO family protein
MRLHGIVGVTRRKYWGTTKRDTAAVPAPNLVERTFAAERPDQLWVADITYTPLECELLDRRRFRSQAEAKMAIVRWIEGWYNPRRRHSSLGRVSPLTYEQRHAAA